MGTAGPGIASGTRTAMVPPRILDILADRRGEDTRRGLAPGAADDIRRGEGTRPVGVGCHGELEMLSKEFPKFPRIGTEREGQGRRVVVASMILGLRESLHGEGGGLTSGSEGGREVLRGKRWW